ncbi:SDR family NAD(P)-dependent oxidoreductase [Ramlibacter humi]|uniref:SDR family NAD(P)-dependent oxidoreductase n=1 Tax=Ramlibacter humi TaxID=2530451 RepID=A0A4Z0C8R2_9BURK|nr:SDR family NAD(P)-dependent oxidoreductase [Ramlibacter humi]TFZ08066.1 SDR family NAD(P)-dependent oxidoreductase [Ramlibacter humi]
MGELQGQVAVVTGASSGIGRAIAIALAAQGACVALVGRRLEALRQVAAAFPAGALPASHHCADLAAGDEVERLARELRGGHERMAVLVHAAGIHAMGPTAQAAPALLDEQYRVHMRAPYVLTQQLLPSLIAGRGQVVFVNSSAALAARAGVSLYAATKLAQKALADGLRAEVNAAGVRVLSVFPGRTATPMQAAVHAAEGRTYDPAVLMQPEDVAAMTLHALALPRTAEVTEIHMRPMARTG